LQEVDNAFIFNCRKKNKILWNTGLFWRIFNIRQQDIKSHSKGRLLPRTDIVETERLEKLLNELADMTAEPVQPDLAESIKQRIPHRLVPHRSGMDTINIIIDLRVSKLAAAAAIIITMVLWGSFLRGPESVSAGLYQDGKIMMKYFLDTGAEGSSASAVKSRYEYLTQKGEDVVYYGDSIDPQDSGAVLMHWRLSDGNYRVVFGDLREKTVSAEELIGLQARILQKKTK